VRTQLTLPAAALLAALLAAPALAEPSVLGEWWMPENSGKMLIAPCAGKPQMLCGTMTWIKPRDPSKPVPVRRDGKPAPDPKSFIGQVLLTDLKPDGPNRFTGGRFQFPGLDRKISAKIRLDKNGTLRLDGCVAAIMCGGQNWKRVV